MTESRERYSQTQILVVSGGQFVILERDENSA